MSRVMARLLGSRARGLLKDVSHSRRNFGQSKSFCFHLAVLADELGYINPFPPQHAAHLCLPHGVPLTMADGRQSEDRCSWQVSRLDSTTEVGVPDTGTRMRDTVQGSSGAPRNEQEGSDDRLLHSRSSRGDHSQRGTTDRMDNAPDRLIFKLPCGLRIVRVAAPSPEERQQRQQRHQERRHRSCQYGTFWRGMLYLAAILCVCNRGVYLAYVHFKIPEETPAIVHHRTATPNPRHRPSLPRKPGFKPVSHGPRGRNDVGTSYSESEVASGEIRPSDDAVETHRIYSEGLGGIFEEGDKDSCPPCKSLFRQLEVTRYGKGNQEVRMQIRGEPKSGTSFIFEWSVNALMVICRRLERLYGEHTCSVKWTKSDRPRSKPRRRITDQVSALDMKVVALEFQPQYGRRFRGASAPACPCHGVNKVTINVSHLYKHNLPVPRNCRWQHVDGVTSKGKGCRTYQGKKVQSWQGTLNCLHEWPCKIVDDRVQMLILRDPRAVVVSTFYYLKTHPIRQVSLKQGTTVNSFALKMLPTICRFVHLRYALLQERMPHKTIEFWYNETLADPRAWHERWLSSAGLHLPDSFIDEASDAAVRRDFDFAAKGIDSHPGGQNAAPARSYEDEISLKVRAQMDDICRVWLPPVLLEKFGIPS